MIFFESYYNFLVWIIIYPFILRSIYLMRQYINPIYMNSICLLECVKFSSPQNWDNHILWKYYDITDTCYNITGLNLNDFYFKTHNTGLIENKILYLYFLITLLYGLYYLSNELIIKKNKQVLNFFGCFVMSWFQGSLFHLISHYQNDITHFNGNVLHHSELKINNDNTAITNTLPPGLLFNFSINYFNVLWLMYLITKRYGIDNKIYCAYAVIIIPIKQLFQMIIIHPYIHTYDKSWYPYPLNLIFRDYEGHVKCHHHDGSCLGDLPLFGSLYNSLLHYHSKLYEYNYIKFKSFEHIILNILIDYILYIFGSIICFMLCFCFYKILPRIKNNIHDKIN